MSINKCIYKRYFLLLIERLAAEIILGESFRFSFVTVLRGLHQSGLGIRVAHAHKQGCFSFEKFTVGNIVYQ